MKQLEQKIEKLTEQFTIQGEHFSHLSQKVNESSSRLKELSKEVLELSKDMIDVQKDLQIVRDFKAGQRLLFLIGSTIGAVAGIYLSIKTLLSK